MKGKFIKSNIKKPWDWELISARIEWKTIISNIYDKSGKKLPWNWDAISYNEKTINIEIIKSNNSAKNSSGA